MCMCSVEVLRFETEHLLIALIIASSKALGTFRFSRFLNATIANPEDVVCLSTLHYIHMACQSISPIGNQRHQSDIGEIVKR